MIFIRRAEAVLRILLFFDRPPAFLLRFCGAGLILVLYRAPMASTHSRIYSSVLVISLFLKWGGGVIVTEKS